MTDPNNKKKIDECDGNLECAEQTLHKSIAQANPEWIDEDGECNSCISLEHEMAADPNKIPDDLET